MFTTFVVNIILCVLLISAQTIPSPCPTVFSYEYDFTRQAWYGEIRAHPPYGIFRIELAMVIGATITNNFFGNIVLRHSHKEIFKRLKKNQELKFYVVFPLQSTLPVPTSIRFNNELVCSSDASIFSDTENTMINLQFTLQTPEKPPPQLTLAQEREPVTVKTTKRQRQALPTSSTTSVAPYEFLDDTCGVSLLPITPLIIGGEPYSRGQWPWLIAVHTQIGAQVYFSCGATLISQTAAITAAHCFFSNTLGRRLKVDEIYLAIGRYDVEKFLEPKTQIMNPSRMIAYESFDFEKLKNRETPKDADIGIMILERPVEFNQFIKPVCLDRSGQTSTATTGVVSGWGLNENRTTSKTPNQVTVMLVSELDCLHEDPVYWYLTSNRTFCAGDKSGRGPCTGDSGGGLVVEHNGRWILRGVVSTAIVDRTKSCDVHKYAIYTDVNKYIDWIDMNLDG